MTSIDDARTLVLFFSVTLVLGIIIGLGLGFALWGIRPPEPPPPTPYWTDEPWMELYNEPDELYEPDEEARPDPLGHLVDELDIWPARHLIISVPGRSLDRATMDLLREIKPGGVLLLPDNIASRSQTEQLIQQIKEAVGLGTGLADLPLIAIAQEGGVANPLALDDAVGAEELAASGNVDEAREAGRRYGEACVRRGIALVLAPVLDIVEGERSALPRDRSFGHVPESVIPLAMAFAEGVMEAGALPVGKYFPGLGVSQDDPEFGFALLLRERRALESVLQPFQYAVERSIPGLLVGHITAPALDPEQPTRPASLSPVMLAGLLRAQWGYKGVILSDDANARAIAATRPPEAAVVEALQAGADAVLHLDRTPLRLRVACKAIELAVQDGHLSRDQLFESMRRLESWQSWLRDPHPLWGDTSQSDESATTEEEPVEAPPLRTHVVQPGEHLSGIATRYGVSVSELRILNNLRGDVIHGGQTLAIPTE